MTMTIEAPAHRLRLILEYNSHAIYLTVTAHAADPTSHVYRVIEIGKVRHLVDLDPVHRLPGFPALLNRRELAPGGS